MFESLSERLGGVFDRLRGRGALNESDVREAMREISLVQANQSRLRIRPPKSQQYRGADISGVTGNQYLHFVGSRFLN